MIEKRRGDLVAAIPHFRRAASLDPDYSEACCSLAGALATLGQTDEALAVRARYRDSGRRTASRRSSNGRSGRTRQALNS